MFRLEINKDWRLHESLLSDEKEQWAYVHGLKDGWYTCSLPADVRMPLIEEGVIKDPVLADYCRESEWIEKRAWWFERTFDSSEVDRDEDIIELILEGLDSTSDIFVNGQYIGSHYSVHYPFVFDIKEKIKEGENVITVRVTSGLETVSDQNLSELNYAVCLETDNGGKYRGDARRAFVRRPQYTVGWDWGPKVITCGITGAARLEGHKKIALREVCLHTEEVGEQAKLKLMLNVENLGFISSRDGAYKVRISYENKPVFEQTYNDRLFTSGYNYFEEEITLSDPELWWPNGYGKQPLYEVQVEAVCEGSVEKFPVFSYGIRKLELDTSVLEGKDRKFQFVINNRPIYCKGGNWIPNDFIYARVTDEKYRVLLDEATEVKADFGYVSFDGTIRETKEIQLELSPRERTYLLKEKLPDRDYKKGTIMLYIHDENIDNIWLRLDDMRNLAFEKSPVICSADHQEGSDRTLTVHSEAFAHGVHIKGNYRCSDNYFDLLPGETKTFTIKNAGEASLELTSVK